MKEKNKGLQRRKYDTDFKTEVLWDGGQRSIRCLCIPSFRGERGLIYRWKQKTKGKEKAAFQDDSTLLSVENQQLKERVRQSETEREI